MKFVDEFNDTAIAATLLEKLKNVAAGIGRVSFMEVCGTHTTAIFRSGVRCLLPENVALISGPGCPVCVTPTGYIDAAISYVRRQGFIVVTFGDMLRVPGSDSSLEKEKASGGDVRVVYSPLDALEIARNNLDKNVVFLGVGFETTAPLTASSIVDARIQRIRNFSLFSAHKIILPAMGALLNAGEVKIDGFICPGHVSTVTGSMIYEPLVRKYKIPCVVAGFEPLDILQTIHMLCVQVSKSTSSTEVQYNRSVSREGNRRAQQLMAEVFEPVDSQWRGLGVLTKSGLGISRKYSEFDAQSRFPVEIKQIDENPLCRCAEVLRGIRKPTECELFAGVCTPQTPEGACMVSSEGTCAAYYKYGTHPAKSAVLRGTPGGQ
jgi:hydrogenase expression/formation protein HypD